MAGQVKTRLAADIGPEAAAALYQRFLHVIFQRTDVGWTRGPRVLFVDPPDAAGVFAAMPHAPACQVPQSGPDLGARMAAAFAYCFGGGADRVVLIGTDAPSMPMAHAEAAWEALAEHDVVLGPATDGGYYLIALRATQPALFQDVPWSTSRVLETTLHRAAELRLAVHLLPEWFDVDTVEDLAALQPGWDEEPAR